MNTGMLKQCETLREEATFIGYKLCFMEYIIFLYQPIVMIWKVLGLTVSNMKINDSHHLSLLPLKIQIIIFFASESAKQTIDYNHNLGFYIGQPVGRECPSFDHQRIPVCITVILLMMNY